MTSSVPASGDTCVAPAARAMSLGLSNGALVTFGSALFVVPNAVFALDLKPIPGTLVFVGCAAALWLVNQGAASAATTLLGEKIAYRLLAICGLFGLALCLLGGEGHFFFANNDWLFRDAVLSDLVRNAHPVNYRYEGQDYLLRAPLGMYMTPALVGRFFGLPAAHLALLAQNTIATTLVLYLSAQFVSVRRIPFLLLMVFFSGADIVPILASEATRLLQSQSFSAFSHIEWWAHLWRPNIALQYSSHITQIFWVPNHALPGWWFGVLLLLQARRAIDFATLAVSFAALLMWSPLAMIGAAPFATVLGLRHLVSPQRFARRVLFGAAAAAMFAPVALYLSLDAGAVAHGFLVGVAGFGSLYALFLLVEIPQVVVIALGWRRLEASDRRLVIGAIVLLVLIPLYSLGPANDFAMRASITPLFLLACCFARIAVLTPRDDSAFPTLISVIALLGAATGLLEIKRSFEPSFAISDCNLLTAWRKDDSQPLPTNYWARAEKTPEWLISRGGSVLTLEDRKCWPDHPMLDDKGK